ncbi:MAG TPA: OmpH family outer membrane protein [Pyrinomonadaceae bacterium]|nr:OmpH family outer membrane protein [Pyrinomonadaceae bacterium]
MKRNFIIPALALLLSIAFSSASAQTRPGPTATPTPVPRPVTPQPAAAPSATVAVPATKIAIVDTNSFGDEKNGIRRYLNAVKTVQASFAPRTKELVDLQSRIKAIADEISKLSGNAVVGQQTIQAKQDEGERLQRDLKYKKEQLDADFDKKFTEVVGPISNDIGKALDQYASQHGLTMILDISKLLPAVLTVNPAMDITQAFITEFNAKNP